MKQRDLIKKIVIGSLAVFCLASRAQSDISDVIFSEDTSFFNGVGDIEGEKEITSTYGELYGKNYAIVGMRGGYFRYYEQKERGNWVDLGNMKDMDGNVVKVNNYNSSTPKLFDLTRNEVLDLISGELSGKAFVYEILNTDSALV